MRRVEISNKDLRKLAEAPIPNLPTHVSPLLNYVNNVARATRPEVVGQMTELVKEFKGHTLEEWKQWYIERHPGVIEEAVNRIAEKLEDVKGAMNAIQKEHIQAWGEDLLITKTFTGLKIQQAILKKMAEILGHDYRLATPDEEARGIDGYIGSISVSIKPSSYKDQASRLSERIRADIIIYYKKNKRGIAFEFEDP